MNEEFTIELIDGLFAYDSGCIDSGIHDNAQKEKLFKYLHSLDKVPDLLNDYALSLISLEGRKSGYSLEDVKSFIDWLSDNGYDL